MLTFSNSGLFYRFLTMLPNQYEPRSVCDLFWRLVLNSLVVVGVIAGVVLYLVGVYGWFTGAFLPGADKLGVVFSTFSAVITTAVTVWYTMAYLEKRKEVKRIAWQAETGGSYWDWYELEMNRRREFKDRLTPLLKKFWYGVEVFADIVFGLYKRVHDKTCVMVEFKDTNPPNAPEAESVVIDIEDDEPDPVDNEPRPL